MSLTKIEREMVKEMHAGIMAIRERLGAIDTRCEERHEKQPRRIGQYLQWIISSVPGLIALGVVIKGWASK